MFFEIRQHHDVFGPPLCGGIHAEALGNELIAGARYPLADGQPQVIFPEVEPGAPVITWYRTVTNAVVSLATEIKYLSKSGCTNGRSTARTKFNSVELLLSAA